MRDPAAGISMNTVRVYLGRLPMGAIKVEPPARSWK